MRGTLFVGGVPADTGTVVLHRVTPEEAGPVDSVRVEAGGRFELRLPMVPGPMSGTFFATHRHSDVPFFGRPITAPEHLEEAYEIRAFPTRPLPRDGLRDGGEEVRFTVSFRNLFIEEGPEGWRVTDVFEVGHEDPVTWTSPNPEAGAPVWAHPLPSGAMNVQAAESDVSVASLRLDRGALEVHAPFPPGDRLFVVRYDLPSLETTVPLQGVTGAVEFLVREPAPAMRVEGLRADAPVELERGSVYRRWWGEAVTTTALQVRLGEETEPPLAWIAVGLALFLVGAGSWMVMRRGAPDPAPAGAPTRRATLLEIAHLEEAAAQGQVPGAEAEARKRILLAELEAAPRGGGEGPGG